MIGLMTLDFLVGLTDLKLTLSKAHSARTQHQFTGADPGFWSGELQPTNRSLTLGGPQNFAKKVYFPYFCEKLHDIKENPEGRVP